MSYICILLGNLMAMRQKSNVVNVRLPEQLVKWLDSLVEQGIYASRSEAVRDFCRKYVERWRNE